MTCWKTLVGDRVFLSGISRWCEAKNSVEVMMLPKNRAMDISCHATA